MPLLPHLQLDLTVDMDTAPPLPPPLRKVTAEPPSIDQVIQNEHPLRAEDSYPPEYRPASPPTVEPLASSYNKTAPLAPPKTQSQKHRAMSMRENTQSPYEERRLLSAGAQNDRSTTMSKYQSPREKEDEERKIKPAVVRQTNSANANHNFLTDFFSPEVFQVVLHNPTTAHRFLRFCQSRACGENLEFLHKVCCCLCPKRGGLRTARPTDHQLQRLI